MDIQKLRRYKRIPVDFRAGVLSRGVHSFSQVISISEGGMMISHHKLLPIGEEIEVQFLLGTDILCVTAEVIYQVPHTPGSQEELLGLKFLAIDSDALRVIQSFIKNA